MTTVLLNDKKYFCPSCWAEMKTRHYIRIIKEWDQDKDIADRDYFKLLNILTDGDFHLFNRNVENEITLMSLIGWVITEPFKFTEKLPKVLQIGEAKISIPEDPRELSIGQNIHLRREIEKTKSLEENIAIAVGIYLQPTIDNSLFSLNRAYEIAKQIEEMPINLIYPIGFFLLKRAAKFGTSYERISLPILTSLKRMLRNLSRRWRKFRGLQDTRIYRL